MKQTFLILLILFIANENVAQVDNSLGCSKSEKYVSDSVFNARMQTLNVLQSNDGGNRIIEKLDYSDFSTYYLTEFLLISFLKKDYVNILNKIIGLDSLAMSDYYNEEKPKFDELSFYLFEKSFKKKQYLKLGIVESELKDEEKELLELMLNYLFSEGLSFIELKQDSTDRKNELINLTLNIMKDEIYSSEFFLISQDSINSIADNFLLKYPKSVYNEFVRTNIRYKYKISDWSFGSQLFMGGISFTDNLSQYYSNSVILGLGVDISYKRLLTCLQVFRGFGKTVDDIYKETEVWKSKSNTSIFKSEITLGLSLIDNKVFRLVGTSGIASTIIGPTSSDKESIPVLEEFELGYSFTYTIGGFVDIKLNKFINNSYSFLRLRYNYCKPSFPNDYEGNLHVITIGYGWSARNAKRIY